MTNRFRMVAGPNGSGKSTLAAWLDLLVPESDLPKWFMVATSKEQQK